jgi:hypothetical protein
VPVEAPAHQEGLDIGMRRTTSRLVVALTTALLLTTAISANAFADKRDFNLNNNSDYVIRQAFVAPSADIDWGDDILGKDVLNPGEVWQVAFDRFDPNTCFWDVKVVTVEGFEVKIPQIDFCKVTDVNINN